MPIDKLCMAADILKNMGTNPSIHISFVMHRCSQKFGLNSEQSKKQFRTMGVCAEILPISSGPHTFLLYQDFPSIFCIYLKPRLYTLGHHSYIMQLSTKTLVFCETTKTMLVKTLNPQDERLLFSNSAILLSQLAIGSNRFELIDTFDSTSTIAKTSDKLMDFLYYL